MTRAGLENNFSMRNPASLDAASARSKALEGQQPTDRPQERAAGPPAAVGREHSDGIRAVSPAERHPSGHQHTASTDRARHRDWKRRDALSDQELMGNLRAGQRFPRDGFVQRPPEPAFGVNGYGALVGRRCTATPVSTRLDSIREPAARAQRFVRPDESRRQLGSPPPWPPSWRIASMFAAAEHDTGSLLARTGTATHIVELLVVAVLGAVDASRKPSYGVEAFRL